MVIPSFTHAIKLTTLGLCLLAVAEVAFATDYYVGTGGSDSNDGSSPATAWRTIQKSADAALAGDTVYIGDGTYNEAVTFSNDGTAANPIRFVAITPGNVLLTTPGLHTLYIDDHDYLHFEGLVLEGVHVNYKSTVFVYNSLGIVFTNCDVSESYHGFDTEQSELTVTSSRIHDCSRELFMPRTGTTLVVEKSELYNSYEDGIHATTTTGGPNPDSTTITVSRCLIHDNGRHGIRTSRCRATISNCLIYNNGYGAPGYGFGIHSQEYSDTTVEHCTIVNNQKYGIRTHTDGSTTLRNSIIAFNGDYGLRGDTLGVFTAGTDYNLLHANGSGNYTQVTPGANDIIADPFFVGGGNYHLQIGSPAIDQGSAGILIDFDGKSRPQGAGVDIGCFEAGPAIYYVRTTGDDSNSGLSPSEAFRTISRAADIATEGAIVHIGGGTYPESVVVQKQGTSSNPIRFLADTSGAETGDSGDVIVTPPLDLQYAWTLENAEYVTLEAIRLSGDGMAQANGLHITNSLNVTVQDCEIDHSIHGVFASFSTVNLDHCHVHDTTTAGVWLDNITDTDLQVSNLLLEDNGNFGLFVDTCDLSFDATNIADWAISGSQIAIGGTGSDLSFDGISVSSGTTASVQLTQCNLTADTVTFSGSGYGLAIDSSNVTLTGCTFSVNSVGLYATQNTLLSATGSNFTGNTLWGASVAPSGAVGETATFTGCTFATNAGGLTLVNATDGDVLLRGATVIRDNSAAGLHFENCQLTVDDQADGLNWSTLRNLYGISSHQSTLSLADLKVENSTSYGLFCQDSSVVVTNCVLTGPYGIYADLANDALKIDKSTLTSGVTPGWGVVRYGGDLTVTNTIVDGFWLGVYLDVASVADQATLLNMTLARITGYGLYVINGDTLVRNTILSGEGAGYGVIRQNGTLTHSHNLINNFGTPYFGLTADATEIQKNARFVDSANGDFHLDVGSPAINAGLDVGLLVPDDREGTARPTYNSYEIGAYEYVSPNGSLRVLDWVEVK